MARKCILCAKEYTYCKSCPKDAVKESWHSLYDTENCRNISKALTDYNFKRITKDEAQLLLKNCDLSIELNEHYRKEINAIMAKLKRTKKQEVEVVVESVEEIQVQPEQEEAKIEEPNGVVVEE